MGGQSLLPWQHHLNECLCYKTHSSIYTLRSFNLCLLKFILRKETLHRITIDVLI